MEANTTDAPRTGDPGAENTSAGGGSPETTDRVTPGAPPAASNQPKAEDFRIGQDGSREPGTIGSADPQQTSAGAALRPAPPHGAAAAGNEDDRLERTGGIASFPAPTGALGDNDATGAARMSPGSPPAPPQTAPTPGDSSWVSVPSAHPAPETSEVAARVSGVRATSSAPPGTPDGPDGDVDTGR
jgi:hypothetical protein